MLLSKWGAEPPVSCERRRARNFPPASSGLELWGGVLSRLSKWGAQPPVSCERRRARNFPPASSGLVLWRCVLSARSSLRSLHASFLRAKTSKKLPLLACICYTCLPNEPLTTARPKSQVNDLPPGADRHGSPAVRLRRHIAHMRQKAELKNGIKKTIALSDKVCYNNCVSLF